MSNQRNVDALARLINEVFDPVNGEMPRPDGLAEFLAAQGCLGPASEVLTDTDLFQLLGDAHDSASHGLINEREIPAALERIARGETP